VIGSEKRLAFRTRSVMSRSNRTARGRIRVSTARSETAQVPAAEAHGVPAKPHAKVRLAQAQAQAVAPPREPEELRAGALQARVTAAVGPSARPAQRTAWPA
jgi:hypothetical protein